MMFLKLSRHVAMVASTIEWLEDRLAFVATPSLVEVPITPGAIEADPALAGYRTFDIRVGMSPGDRFVSAGLDVALTAGQFYRAGDLVTPDSSTWAEHPNHRFATFVCVNGFAGPSATLPWSDRNIPLISDTRLQVAWAQFGGTPAGVTDFTIARITVSADAVGALVGQTYGINEPFVHMPIVESILPGVRPLAWINGSVIAPGGEHFDNVRVFADLDDNGQLDPGEPTSLTVATRYSMIVPPGQYKLRVELPEDFRLVSPAIGWHDVELADGQTAAGRDFRISSIAHGAVEGTVRWFDRLENGATLPLAGVTIFADQNQNDVLDAGEPSAQTLSDGTYRLDNLPVGSTVIGQIVPAGFASTEGAFQHVLVPVDATVNQVDFTNYQTTTAAARGVVRLAADVSPGGGNGLQGWTVYLDRNRNGQLDGSDISTTTTAQGNFDLRASASTYDLRIAIPPGFSPVAPQSGLLAASLVGGFATTGLNFTVRPINLLARVSGSVQQPAAEVSPGSSTALPGWTVYIDSNRNGRLDSSEQRTLTNQLGSYAFENLNPGAYRIAVQKPTGWRYVSGTPGMREVEVSAGQSLGGQQFLYTRRIMIAGVVFEDKNANQVKDAGENGVRGRRVWVDFNNNSRIDAGEPGGYVGAKGMWGFESLVTGTYTVRVEEITGWRNTGTGAFTVTLSAGQVRVGVPFGQQKISTTAARALPPAKDIGRLRPADDLSSTWAMLR